MAGLTGVPGCCSEAGPWGASQLQRGTGYNATGVSKGMIAVGLWLRSEERSGGKLA